MIGPFIRFYRKAEEKEILINASMIWKVEVSYVVKGERDFFTTSLEDGLKDPNALRLYRVFVGGETIKVAADPDDPVMKMFDEIYKSSLKN